MTNNLKSIFFCIPCIPCISCIFQFFTCRKKPIDDNEDLMEYHKIYGNNSSK